MSSTPFLSQARGLPPLAALPWTTPLTAVVSLGPTSEKETLYSIAWKFKSPCTIIIMIPLQIWFLIRCELLEGKELTSIFMVQHLLWQLFEKRLVLGEIHPNPFSLVLPSPYWAFFFFFFSHWTKLLGSSRLLIVPKTLPETFPQQTMSTFWVPQAWDTKMRKRKCLHPQGTQSLLKLLWMACFSPCHP